MLRAFHILATTAVAGLAVTFVVELFPSDLIGSGVALGFAALAGWVLFESTRRPSGAPETPTARGIRRGLGAAFVAMAASCGTRRPDLEADWSPLRLVFVAVGLWLFWIERRRPPHLEAQMLAPVRLNRIAAGALLVLGAALSTFGGFCALAEPDNFRSVNPHTDPMALVFLTLGNGLGAVIAATGAAALYAVMVRR